MGQSMKKVERWKMEMPTEAEMLPKDKYSVFDRKVKRYRKGIHSTYRCERVGDARAGLMCTRGAKVDEGQSETQSSWFLRFCWEEEGQLYIMCLSYPLHRCGDWTNDLCIPCDLLT